MLRLIWVSFNTSNWYNRFCKRNTIRRNMKKFRVVATFDEFSEQNKAEIEWFIRDFGKIDEGINSPKFSTPGLTASRKLALVQWQLQLHRSADARCLVMSLRDLTDAKVSLTLKASLDSSKIRLSNDELEGKPGNMDLEFHLGDVFKTYDASRLKDVLIICSISKVRSGKEEVGSEKNKATVCAEDSASELVAQYESLLETERFSDVVFNIGEKSMRLHKSILSSASEVFRAMFDHEMGEQKENVVDVVDVDFDVMKEVMRYIYARKVNGIEKIAAELFVAADRYAVEGLKQLCENELVDKLNVDNALSRFELSMKFGMLKLKAKVLKFLARNLKELVGKQEFKELSSDCNHLDENAHFRLALI